MSPIRDSLVDALSMKGGTGEHSYATNSHYQRSVFYEMQHVVAKNVRAMLEKVGFPDCIKVADLGCSTGQNTLLAISAITDTIMASYQQTDKPRPETVCYLNDLQENDFNTTFKLVPSFLENLKMEEEEEGRCFVAGVPGSFYSRLFPKKSLHFVHSAFSIHWLSKVPNGLESNTQSIHIKYPYTHNVYKSYSDQFKNDFGLFLKLRSEEIVHNGSMVLTFVGRKVSNTLSEDCFQVWSLLSDCLLELVSEGFVKESEMSTFNMPFYNPNEEEVRDIISKEGSFEIKTIEKFDHVVPYKIEDEEEDLEDQSFQLEAGLKQARWARCITEPLLVAHFGNAIIEPVFNKYAHYMAKYLSVSNHRPNMTLVFVVSLSKK